MGRFVVDCSVVMAWCFEDEADEYADSVLYLLRETEAVVPGIWLLEVANVLLVGERKHRLTKADSARFIKLLRELPIVVDQETPDYVFTEVLSTGRLYGLSAYDAAYLELAMREGTALATRDSVLRQAALQSGVKLV
ncbi:MAG: type II toxin-antitoxin system VapC family toxin [Candidatus Desulforudis sp.]|nr:type II toxin-antitoxin system VapC family toxin [Desulforudis sp.]